MSSNSPSLPRLVQDDCWLEPYAEHIAWRMQNLKDQLASIEKESGSIERYSQIHKQLGIHYDTDKDIWTVKEWAPGAHYVSIIGDFNEWDASKHPLSKGENCIWQLELSGRSLKHGDAIKLHVYGADGSARDRIPATIQR